MEAPRKEKLLSQTSMAQTAQRDTQRAGATCTDRGDWRQQARWAVYEAKADSGPSRRCKFFISHSTNTTPNTAHVLLLQSHRAPLGLGVFSLPSFLLLVSSHKHKHKHKHFPGRARLYEIVFCVIPSCNSYIEITARRSLSSKLSTLCRIQIPPASGQLAGRVSIAYHSPHSTTDPITPARVIANPRLGPEKVEPYTPRGPLVAACPATQRAPSSGFGRSALAPRSNRLHHQSTHAS